MALDTNTYNEIDDQFAVAYALLSPERLKVEALYAAPFLNDRSDGPGEGMDKSYQEILSLLERLGHPAQDFVYHVSTTWLRGRDVSERSPAALDLVARHGFARRRSSICPGDRDNFQCASAILIGPEIICKIVIVWLGGQPHRFH